MSHNHRIPTRQSPSRWHGLGLSVVLLSACAATPESPTSDATAPVSVILAAQSGDCLTTANGLGAPAAAAASVLDGVDSFVLRWQSADTPPKTGVVRAKRSSLTQSYWQVKLPVMDNLSVDIDLCNAAGDVVLWHGHSDGLKVENQKETKAFVFLTPSGKLACAGRMTAGKLTGGSLQSGTALAGGAAITGGNALVVGGVRTWDNSKQLGAGGPSTEVFDYQQGTFRPGPQLLAPRILPHVNELANGKFLVAGGIGSVRGNSSAAWPVSLMAPDQEPGVLVVSKAEVLDSTLDSSGKGVETAAKVGAGNLPFSSALRQSQDIVYAGGVGPDGKPSNQATRLKDLLGIANGGPGSASDFTLKVARVQPALVRLGADTLVWGGQATGLATDAGEWIAADIASSEALTVTGDSDLLADTKLATAGAAVALLSSTADSAVLLVVGGVPLSTPHKAQDVPSYVVVVSLKDKTAQIKKIQLSQGVLRGGLGTLATVLPTGEVLVAGGLLALQGVTGVCDGKPECILDSWVVLAPPTDVSGAQVPLTVLDSGTFAAPQFGVIGLPLPGAELLAGGQHSVVAGDSGLVLDPAGRLLSIAPLAIGICTP